MKDYASVCVCVCVLEYALFCLFFKIMDCAWELRQIICPVNMLKFY